MVLSFVLDGNSDSFSSVKTKIYNVLKDFIQKVFKENRNKNKVPKCKPKWPRSLI